MGRESGFLQWWNTEPNPRPRSSPESVRKPAVTILDHSAIFAVVHPVKQAVKVAVFDMGKGSQSPSEVGRMMRAPDGNTLAFTQQGDCISMNTLHICNRSALWLPPLKLNPP
jgi:hypothetical protein